MRNTLQISTRTEKFEGADQGGQDYAVGQ